MKKLFAAFFCSVFLFLFSACDNEKPGIVFSDSPFIKQTPPKLKSIFHKGQRIYFAVYNPKGFKTRLLKLQIFKKESEKSEFFGYEYLYNKTIELDNKHAATDYAVINNSGFYIFQIFDYTDFLKPVAIGVIKVE